MCCSPLHPSPDASRPGPVPRAGLARRRVRVVGRVQGVGFRVSCARVARGLQVSGAVRNLPDGSVEVVAQGDAAAVGRLVAWCRSGPSAARVEGVEVTAEPVVDADAGPFVVG